MAGVEDLSAVPPGSSLASSKIYGLIHLCCCHMPPLPPPPWASPSITPSPPSHLGGPSSSRPRSSSGAAAFVSKVSADLMALPSAAGASLGGATRVQSRANNADNACLPVEPKTNRTNPTFSVTLNRSWFCLLPVRLEETRMRLQSVPLLLMISD